MKGKNYGENYKWNRTKSAEMSKGRMKEQDFAHALYRNGWRGEAISEPSDWHKSIELVYDFAI